MFSKIISGLFLAISSISLFPSIASAHAFGLTYTLPLPLWIFAYGGAAAVIASFLIISYLVGKEQTEEKKKEIDITDKGFLFVNKNWFIKGGKVISISLFLLAVITGLIGTVDSYFNLTLFWILFVLGFTYLTAIIGNVYDTINPIKLIINWLEKVFGLGKEPIFRYPQWLGYYPALILYFAFIYIELFGKSGAWHLSFALLQYLGIAITAVIFIGKEAWFKYCDFFAVFFRLIGKVSVFYKENGRLYLRMPFSGLLRDRAEDLSLVIFILFMLSSTAYDGFHSTRAFFDLNRDWLWFLPYVVYRYLLLFISPFIFLGIYAFLVWLTKLITKSEKSLKELILYFAFSLIPIAFVYNVAHYYVLLITEGQHFIRVLSDPLGFGWNLFGTGDWEINMKLVDTVITWYVQLALILIGHIVGVYLAHVDALKIFPNNKRLIWSQIPMLILMVLYTMAGLWILAQPVTDGGLL